MGAVSGIGMGDAIHYKMSYQSTDLKLYLSRTRFTPYDHQYAMLSLKACVYIICM